MLIENELNAIPKPKVYNRQGMKCFYDPYRENMVPATPEEEVRQKLLIWLEKEMCVPAGMIIVEQRLSKYGINNNDRADIVIHRPDDDGRMLPIAVVECKAPTVSISDEVLRQCFNYADDLGIDFAIVSNGVEFFAYHYLEKDNIYMELETCPNYSQLLNGEISGYVEPEKPPRPCFEKLMDEEVQGWYDGFVGVDTPTNLKAHCINLFECLMDTQCHLAKKHGQKFSIIEDKGMIRPKFGNTGGGEFVMPCRAFLIEDNHKSNKMVSIGITSYVTEKRDKEKTALCIGIRDKNKSHHALQLVMDTYVLRTTNKYVYTNTGRIAVSNKGSGSAEKLVKKVSVELPHLYDNGKIYLGSVSANKLLMMDDLDVTDLIINLIDYSLLRDEYRDEMTGK